MLAAHFAEPPPKCDGTCDLCAAAAAAAGGEGGQPQQPQQQDLTEAAKLAVQVLQVRACLWEGMGQAALWAGRLRQLPRGSMYGALLPYAR